MDLSLFRLIIVFIGYLVYDPQSCWTSEEGEEDLYTKKTLALYRKLKQEPDTFLDRLNLTVAKEDLKPPNVNSSDDVKVMLFDQGYLKVSNKPEKPGGLCKLEFPHASEMWLYANLVNAAEREDRDVANAISEIKTTFERMPPEIDDFKSLMLAVETVLSAIPRLFTEWQIAAMFGTFYMSELNVTIGRGPIDHGIIYCNDLPNNTCMRFVVDFAYQNVTYAWDSYYRDLLTPGLLRRDVRRKHLLAGIASFSRYKPGNNVIRDWYAQFESSPPRQPIREYRP